jgi:CheY-specific phosphatase CheX
MEKQKLLQAAKTSISEVLETMFFLPIDHTDMVEAIVFNGAVKDHTELVEISFSGMFSGTFLLVIPDDLAMFLTASFLGSIEDEVLPVHISETKKEMANMIAGNTFTHFNDQIEFDLGIPEIVSAQNAMSGSGHDEEIIYQSHTLEQFLFIRVTLED